MGVQGLHEYIEKHCPSAVVPVELGRLARHGMAVVGGGGGGRRPRAPARPRPLRLLLDADSCLHRLYGGLYTDWVSGGQWNGMLGFVAALARACAAANIRLLVCFNGALEKGRLHDWLRRQLNERQTAQQILSHVHNRGTPPPKVWFLPPVCMAHCIRLALLRLRVGVVQSLEDHHLEVIALCREKGFHGLVAYDSDYALSNIPHYFSGHALKLSRNGRSLTTSRILMQQVARQLHIQPDRFVIFASLLGNHILPDEDLAAFHWSLLGPEHPLASLKVRAHQLVLPPCDVVIKAVADYIRNIPEITDLDSIAKDIFKHSQSCTDDKVFRFKKAVEYYSAASKAPHNPLHLIRPKQVQVAAGAAPHTSPKALHIPAAPPAGRPTVERSRPEPPAERGLSNIPPDGKHKPLYERSTTGGPEPPAATAAAALATSSENGESSATTANHVTDVKAEREKNGNPAEGDPQDQSHADLCVTSGNGAGRGLGAQIPSLLSMPTRNHMDVTIPPLPEVAPEVLRVAEHRHRRGLMYPYIYHLLTKGEVKLSVAIEDEANKELPSAVQLFRPLRQYVYGVLFSLAETRKKAERLAMRKNCLPEYAHVMVKEWAAHKGKSPHTPELVEALAFREWTCPNLKKLWLGKAAEDKNRRMRAFLACMRSDTPAMLSPASVPAPLLVLCCVLRFMLQWPGVRILRRNELDAFLAQALSPKLYEPDQLQELKIDNLDSRGVQLAALFMSGVDMALLANDACGQPVPWEHCCPWMYFDGKLFQSKLVRSGGEKAQLIDLCDGQAELATKVEKMRQSILEGLSLLRPPHPVFLHPPPPQPPHGVPFYPHNGSFYPMPHPGRARGPPAGLQSQGGKLEIAGTVVGQWAGVRRPRGRGGFPVQVVSVGGANRGRPRGVISTPVFRTFGRGGTRFHARVFRSQGFYLSKPAHVAGQQAATENRKPQPEEGRSSPAGGLRRHASPTVNGVEDGEPHQLNGDDQDQDQDQEEDEECGAFIQHHSAFNADAKAHGSQPQPPQPQLSALHAAAGCHGDGAPEPAAAAAVVAKEE